MIGHSHQASQLPSAMPAPIHAVLGPTNTGKTHYALTRMMAHSSGMIGFPLRLLARENYERLVELKGEQAVALLTGEEKIIPPKARWFSCTVEAMPLDRRVDFVGVDEIQLAADPDRGHVFTDRLLHARGRGETLFLGAETIKGLLTTLVPEMSIDTRSRLSQLNNIGPLNLTRLPARSVIVAFSVTEVYAIAEAIRQKRGGCAIIMGRLSPRTRNAQVELYQNRDVDYLVATDAIGMGLNMDVDHVALASLRKFDGMTARPLTPQEVAQIVGRAGRGMKDGTFGTTATCTPMSVDLIKAVEEHRFDSIRQIYWRQTHLNYDNPEALFDSLTSKPPRKELIIGRTASDLNVLNTLIHTPDIRQSVKGRRATALLWEVCQIPDFRKLGDGSHARLCGRIFLDLLNHHHLPSTWIEGQLRSLDHTEGDIDTLMHRLSGVRVCAYVASHPRWIRHNVLWQEKSRAVEDRLSDTLHERLTGRFVNKRATALLRRPTPGENLDVLYAVTPRDRIIVEGHDIGYISGFSLKIDVPTDHHENQLLLRAGKRAIRQAMPERIRQFMKEKEDAFIFNNAGHIIWNDTIIARLSQGQGFFQPDVQLCPGEFQDVTQMRFVHQHVRQIAHLYFTQRLQHLFAIKEKTQSDSFLRGLVHRLIEDGGMTPTLTSDLLPAAHLRRRLKQLDIVVGEQFSFFPFLFKPTLMPLITLLHNIWRQCSLTPPHPSRKSLPTTHPTPLPGWVNAGPIMIRVDTLEQFLSTLTHQRRAQHTRPAPHHLSSLLGIKKQYLPEVLKSLHITHRSPTHMPPGHYGPPAPLMLIESPKKRPQRHKYPIKRRSQKSTFQQRTSSQNIQSSPFAALSHWKPPHHHKNRI